MIDFRPIELNDKKLYNEHLYQSGSKGCEYSFSNLFMWGLQGISLLHNHIVLYSRYDSFCFYPFPLGSGDKKEVLDTIFTDAKKRDVCGCLTGLNEEDKKTLETLYPNQFYFHADRGNYDYVYDINDLADLKGRKLHRKRNHLKHFKKYHPGYVVTSITTDNLDKVRTFVNEWYKLKLEDNPDGDYHNEQAALEKVFTFYDDLAMEGLLLEENDKVLGFTIASQMSPDTFDVHYEKARGDIDGAYTTINNEFANYLRNKYPHIKYLDREEDMGIPGLRKAKMSYYPHHLVKKYRAYPLFKNYSYAEPTADMIPTLRELWKEAFGDSESFLDNFFSTAFDKTRCRISTITENATDNNLSTGTNTDLAAVLYWFDVFVDNQRMAYIYAVATAKKYRGNGACHTLLADTHDHLKKLGYAGAILVPGNESLTNLYEGCEYEVCSKRTKIECCAENMGIIIREIDKEEFASLRRNYLPKGGVIQEGISLDFLETQAKFYAGEDFLLAATIENNNLYGTELLGDATLAPGIVYALGCKDGTLFTPGKGIPFAMFHALTEDVVTPSYLGFAFD